MGHDPPASDDVDLTVDERALVDGMYLRLATSTLYELLGVPRSADRRAVRDAYFGLSQRFHPDAFYGKKLGRWKPRIEEIFRDVTRAYDVLTNRTKRAEYDATLPREAPEAARPSPVAPAPVAPPSPSPPPPDPSASALTRMDALLRAPMQDATVDNIRPPRLAAGPARAPLPPAVQPGAGHVAIDVETARRAAREALARKLSGRTASSPNIPAAVDRRPGAAPPAVVAPTGPKVSPLASFEASRVARVEAERDQRVAQLFTTIDAAYARKDYAAAANALALVGSVAPDDPRLRARVDEASQRITAAVTQRAHELAQAAEARGAWDEAAIQWQRVAVGRPTDAGAHERAANALFRAQRDLPRAAELGRRAAQLDPRSVDAYVTLAQIFTAGRLRASAVAALETASRLDPTSVVVKDLMQKLKG